MASKKLNFEESMARLETIVSQLERGEVPLEQSIALFEEGTKLIAGCSKLLDSAEQKVQKLSKGPDGEPVGQPFESEE
ncbi:MAG: exodeoxyribonuclease VII small subunit [Clostridiales bacterium]|nr:exodeoxyribonuclease VII small subunit [Clostridiales bacterium]MCD7761349.1 exodeoxyribonuclease VII small subunit [Clostridiales bacterium]MCD7803487.1 exodeoxyribonuclease VII small subunit [Clostridiales bacterium]MCD7880762.1 exodeoxyribonuclease VII small subunit [Clostridiales bacterium]MCD8383531.1 exodeoxyribonuclease VII small subunit [Clostridiales bacterium]